MGEYITIVYGGRELRFRDPNQDGKVSARELPQSQLRERLLAGKAPNFDVAVTPQVIGSIVSAAPALSIVTSDGNTHVIYGYKTHQYSARFIIPLEEAAKLIELEGDREGSEESVSIIRSGQKRLGAVQAQEMFFMDWVRQLLEGRSINFAGCPDEGYRWDPKTVGPEVLERVKGLQTGIDGYLAGNYGKVLGQLISSAGESADLIRQAVNTMLRNSINGDIKAVEDGLKSITDSRDKEALSGLISELKTIIGQNASLVDNGKAFELINRINALISGSASKVAEGWGKLAGITAPYNMTRQKLAAAGRGLSLPFEGGMEVIINLVLSARGTALEGCAEHWALLGILENMPGYRDLREKVFAGMEKAKSDMAALRAYYIRLGVDPSILTDAVLGAKISEFSYTLETYALKRDTEAALAAYKKEHVGPMVQRAEQVLRTHGLIGSMNRDTSTVVSSLNDLLVMANDKQREGKMPGIRRFCFLIKDRAELNPKPDGSKSDIVQIAEAAASALGIPVDSVEYIVAPGVIESSCGSCHTADEKAPGHYVAVELACDASDPDDIVVNAVWKNVGLSLYSAMFPWKNTEDLDPLELMLGGDFSKLILGQNASEGRPPMAGYIDRAPAEFGRRITHPVEHKLYSLTKPEFSYILGLIFNRTKGKVDLRAETELLWELAVKARDKAGSEEMLGGSLAAVLAEAGASGHVKRAFDVILANLSEELPLYEEARIGILPSVMGTERYRRSTLDTIVERVRQHNSVVVNGRRLTDQDFDRFDKLKEEAEKRSYLSVLLSAEPIRTVKISVGRDGKPVQEVRQFVAADVMRRAFYSYWRDRVSSPRFFSGDLCRVMNELDKAGLEPSEREVFDFSEQDWIGRIEQMLLRSAQEGGQSPDEESLKLIKSKAESIGGFIYKAIFESKINALLRYVPQDSFEEQALQKIRGLVIREKTA